MNNKKLQFVPQILRTSFTNISYILNISGRMIYTAEAESREGCEGCEGCDTLNWFE